MTPSSPLPAIETGSIPSPALLILPDRAEANVRRMISMAGGAARLRPHIKTHKLAPLMAMQIRLGIEKFKCATLAEAEMAAKAGAADVLYAYQPTGPNIALLRGLADSYPGTRFGCLIDDEGAALALSAAFAEAPQPVNAWLDLDIGMGRTGIAPGSGADALYARLTRLPGIAARGLHCYDGHLHQSDLAERTRLSDEAFAHGEAMRDRLRDAGLPEPEIIAGGTPTFPCHARRENVTLSPGTCVLWDAGYAENLPDLRFAWAALLLTRVASKPGTHRLCLDLGHKAVSAENPIAKRVRFPALPAAAFLSQSEEHLVIESPHAAEFKVGDALLGVPWHVCPTVALYSEATPIIDGRPGDPWPVARWRRVG
ncbi:MAG: D-TA family PLP-dependent enzyme [Verrucomicrobiales bacterium]